MPAFWSIPRSLPCVHRRRCAATRRRPEANSRNALPVSQVRLAFEEVDEPAERVEADDVGGVGDEVREGVDIVIDEAAVAVVDHVFDAADVDGSAPHDRFASADDVVGRRVAFDFEAGLGGVDGTGGALELDAVGALADVGGAEVEGFARCEDLDRIEDATAQDFDADDVAAAGGNVFLNERRVIDAEIEAVFGGGAFEVGGLVEAYDAGAAAADVRFHDDREAKAVGRGGRLRWVVEHAGRGVREAQRFEERQLAGLAGFDGERVKTVDDGDLQTFEMGEPAKGVEHPLDAAAKVGGRAHAVEDERVGAFGFGRVVAVRPWVEADVRKSAAVEFRKERPEPVGMLVVDGKGFGGLHEGNGSAFGESENPSLSILIGTYAFIRETIGYDRGWFSACEGSGKMRGVRRYFRGAKGDGWAERKGGCGMALTSDDILTSLEGTAERADRDSVWPQESWDALRPAGAFGWSIPREYGGQGRSAVELLRGQEQIAAACLTTAFILSQREAAVRHFLRGPTPLKDRFLPGLASGEIFATVGLSQLTTSRQHGGPALRAVEAKGGYRLEGNIPWVTGADRAQVVVIGATLPDGKQILVALPSDTSGVTIDPPLRLAALAGSRTAAMHCADAFIDARFVLAGPAERVLGLVGGGGLETSNLALGHAEAATRFLEHEAQARAELGTAAARFRESVSAARARLHGLAAAPAPDATMAVRVDCTRLALRASQAALLAAKGSGFVGPHPAQRWVRQAMFFLVWSCPRPVAAGVLEDLLPLE